ncbi:hypothetical protein BTA35_0216820, partial [Oceanospirillum linum]
TFPQLDNIGTLSMQSDISSQLKGQTFKGALGSNNTVIQTVVTLDGKEIASKRPVCTNGVRLDQST